MDKYVEGHYRSVEEAVHAAKALLSQGYANEDLLFVTNDSTKSELAAQTEMDVTTDLSLDQEDNDQDESIMDKIKDTFTSNDNDDSDRDSETTKQLQDHKEAIRAGDIFLLAATAPSLDRDPTTEPNSGYDNHSSIQDPEVSSIPQTTDGFKKDNPEDIHVDNSDIMHRP